VDRVSRSPKNAGSFRQTTLEGEGKTERCFGVVFQSSRAFMPCFAHALLSRLQKIHTALLK
jgi:hypothetical protein